MTAPLATIGYVDAAALFDSIERAVLRKLNGMDRGELAACKARLAKCVRERAELLDVCASVEHALRAGYSAETVLEPESAVRMAMQAAVRRAAGSAE